MCSYEATQPLLLLISFTANSSDLSAPQAAADKFFQYFNAKDIESMNKASGRPFIFSAGGEVIRWNSYGEALDFEALEESGWAYSRIHQNRLVYEDDMTAMVDINFSRYESTGAVITTSDVIYLFVKRDGAWKIKSAFVKGNLTLGR